MTWYLILLQLVGMELHHASLGRYADRTRCESIAQDYRAKGQGVFCLEQNQLIHLLEDPTPQVRTFLPNPMAWNATVLTPTTFATWQECERAVLLTPVAEEANGCRPTR